MKMITVIKGDNCYKVRLSKEQVEKLRAEIRGCDLAPIAYAGAVLLSQGGGWFHIVPERKSFDFVADTELMRGMVRKIRSVLAPHDAETETVGEYVPPYVGGTLHVNKAPRQVVHPPHQLPRSEAVDKVLTPAPEGRLHALANRINSRFHRR